MGWKVLPPVPGSLCAVCWGIGKAFGNVYTPKYLHAIVSGVIRNAGNPPSWPPAPNGTYHLVQSASPCIFSFINVWTWHLRFDTTYTNFSIAWGYVVAAFNNSPPSICVTGFTNDYQNPGMAYYGGSVSIIV